MNPRSKNGDETGDPYTSQWPSGPAQPFLPASLMAQQQRSGEAMAAAGRAFLEGMQHVATRSFMVQSALFRQFFVGTLALLRAGSGGQADQAVRDLGAASDATAKSIRDIVEAACKCSLDTMAAFRNRIEGGEAGGTEDETRSRHGR